MPERFLGEPDVPRTVFEDENLDGLASGSNRVHAFPLLSSNPKWNVEPCPIWDWTEMLPPCRSTIFLQMANPIPVPSNSSRLCSR